MTNKAKCRGLYACMGEWPDGGWLPDVAASWRVLTDGIGSGELTVGFCQLAATSGGHPPSGHSPMHAYNPLHFALFVILLSALPQ